MMGYGFPGMEYHGPVDRRTLEDGVAAEVAAMSRYKQAQRYLALGESWTTSKALRQMDKRKDFSAVTREALEFWMLYNEGWRHDSARRFVRPDTCAVSGHLLHLQSNVCERCGLTAEQINGRR